MNFPQFLNELSDVFTRVIAPEVSKKDFAHIDLSTDNPSLQSLNITEVNVFKNYLYQFLKLKNAKIAYGGYLEQRNLYKNSSLFNNTFSNKSREYHLGIDFWAPSGTPVLASLDAEVYSLKNNAGSGDYGPTIILKHQQDAVEFYSLYGHLSHSSLTGLKLGQRVVAGQAIGNLGEAAVNGGYVPHLHYQIIKNLGNYDGDYPGVCSYENLDFFVQNCPDPNWLLKIF